MGATKAKVMQEELPETTKKLFTETTQAVLSNIEKLCQIAVDAQSRAALLVLGQGAATIINAALQQIEQAERDDDSMSIN